MKGRHVPICGFTKPVRAPEARAGAARPRPGARLAPQELSSVGLWGSVARGHLLRPEGARRACLAQEQSSAMKARDSGGSRWQSKCIRHQCPHASQGPAPRGRREAEVPSWRGERMRDDESASRGQSGALQQTPLSLKRRTNTCPGNAPMQLSLATGLVQGGERGHCKGNRERPVSRRRDYAQVEQRTQAPLVLHRPRAWRERGGPAIGWRGGCGTHGSQLSKLLERTSGGSASPPSRE